MRQRKTLFFAAQRFPQNYDGFSIVCAYQDNAFFAGLEHVTVLIQHYPAYSQTAGKSAHIQAVSQLPRGYIQDIRSIRHDLPAWHRCTAALRVVLRRVPLERA